MCGSNHLIIHKFFKVTKLDDASPTPNQKMHFIKHILQWFLYFVRYHSLWMVKSKFNCPKTFNFLPSKAQELNLDKFLLCTLSLTQTNWKRSKINPSSMWTGFCPSCLRWCVSVTHLIWSEKWPKSNKCFTFKMLFTDFPCRCRFSPQDSIHSFVFWEAKFLSCCTCAHCTLFRYFCIDCHLVWRETDRGKQEDPQIANWQENEKNLWICGLLSCSVWIYHLQCGQGKASLLPSAEWIGKSGSITMPELEKTTCGHNVLEI